MWMEYGVHVRNTGTEYRVPRYRCFCHRQNIPNLGINFHVLGSVRIVEYGWSVLGQGARTVHPNSVLTLGLSLYYEEEWFCQQYGIHSKPPTGRSSPYLQDSYE